jgi:hypothetical protein
MASTSFQELKVVLTSTQILAMHTSPVALVPGRTGCIIDVNSIYYRYLHGGTPFNPAGDDSIFLTEGSVTAGLVSGFIATGFVDQSVDMSTWAESPVGGFASGEGGNAATLSAILGAGLFFTQTSESNPSQGANWTQGNGQIAVFVKYAYVEIP